MRAAVYCRVSTREQGDSGLGLAAQKARCMAELQSRGWSLATIVEEVSSLGKRRTEEFNRLMRLLDLGQADALVVSRLDRLTRSVIEFGPMVERAQRKGWQLVILDPMLDMTTPSGRAMAGVAVVFSQWEREMTSLRTREGLAQLKLRGVTKTGKVYVPRQPYSDQKTIRRIVRLRQERGMSQKAIAEFLTEAGVPTPHEARKWNHKTIGIILRREGVA
jgi:DNA invertase Pin-like site-specific DNA recombinase